MVQIIGSSSALRKRKTLKKSINYTVMVVGQSGCGRSTFINSFCDQQIVEASSSIPLPDDSDYPKRDLVLRKSSVELEDNEGIRIAINFIDTPGFGDSIENEFNFNLIVDYIKHQYDEVLIEESRLKRNPRFKDGRVHCCLYFITPTGHGLREIDIELMKNLASLVNIIPVISKADSLTLDELKLNKRLIMEDINFYNIPIFKFNEYTYEDEIDEESFELNNHLQKILPFAVMGSNEVIEDREGKRSRIRKYPWGIVDIENNEISDFSVLKNTLLVTHLNELKEKTYEILYEDYRTNALSNNDFRIETPVIRQGENTSIKDSPLASISNNDYAEKEREILLEEERLKTFEERIKKEIYEKEKEIAERERELNLIAENMKQNGEY
ncbi:hypothetical protein PACTADRAFT_50951 [Pachysolen tannophilus NRRL Y-2460]|uniref:Septin-type G domain-containing protein n=1 Tax=Pachysolen tannophilus NRRL Y-2460 TaxID=669874 RepID=A0A1E4TQL2_PACTA|nr:hypothetical protein PACTADRAFT_50951 [Pachysolen tannophilus NRRL Y-2460]